MTDQPDVTPVPIPNYTRSPNATPPPRPPPDLRALNQTPNPPITTTPQKPKTENMKLSRHHPPTSPPDKATRRTETAIT
ncbi:hypothetical protein IMZ48_46145 [Candidatus Bathyarchaeota archaeon]|nr:hypothetical protein [Candidatus Bathyarchaeota archaeon]